MKVDPKKSAEEALLDHKSKMPKENFTATQWSEWDMRRIVLLHDFWQTLEPCSYQEQTLKTQQAAQGDDVREVHEYLADKYFIVKRGLYYRPDAAGYTINPNSAGLYSKDEAERHLAGCSGLTMKPAFRIRAATSAGVEVVKVGDFIHKMLPMTDIPKSWGQFHASVEGAGLKIVQDRRGK